MNRISFAAQIVNGTYGAEPGIAQFGRNGDTTAGHLTPGEIVVPHSAQTPDVMAALLEALGPRFERYQVGGEGDSINPVTGLREFMEDGGGDPSAGDPNSGFGGWNGYDSFGGYDAFGGYGSEPVGQSSDPSPGGPGSGAPNDPSVGADPLGGLQGDLPTGSSDPSAPAVGSSDPGVPGGPGSGDPNSDPTTGADPLGGLQGDLPTGSSDPTSGGQAPDPGYGVGGPGSGDPASDPFGIDPGPQADPFGGLQGDLPGVSSDPIGAPPGLALGAPLDSPFSGSPPGLSPTTDALVGAALARGSTVTGPVGRERGASNRDDEIGNLIASIAPTSRPGLRPGEFSLPNELSPVGRVIAAIAGMLPSFAGVPVVGMAPGALAANRGYEMAAAGLRAAGIDPAGMSRSQAIASAVAGGIFGTTPMQQLNEIMAANPNASWDDVIGAWGSFNTMPAEQMNDRYGPEGVGAQDAIARALANYPAPAGSSGGGTGVDGGNTTTPPGSNGNPNNPIMTAIAQALGLPEGVSYVTPVKDRLYGTEYFTPIDDWSWVESNPRSGWAGTIQV